MAENTTPTMAWESLTPEEKREARFQALLNPEKASFTPEVKKAYQARAQRLIDVYSIREPDRVPVVFSYGPLPLFAGGSTFHEGMYDFNKAAELYNRFNEKYAEALDSFASPVMVPPGTVLELLDYKMYLWPGHGLPTKNEGYQFVEGEYMKADEYDALILNPSDFWMRTYLPRIFGALAGLREMDSLTDIIELPIFQLMPLGNPNVMKALEALVQAGKEMQKRTDIIADFAQRGLDAGFPSPRGAFCKAPFDIIGDTLRGTQNIMMDMYRRPDKLLEAMDVIADVLIKSVLDRSRSAGALAVTFPLHKGADGWMSQKQFDKFYWPSLKKVIDAFIGEGLHVTLFAEGALNSRLEAVNVFPKGFVHWFFDQTDIVRAKEILGDTCCIQGNVPASVLMTGTPDDVKAYCRKLIETCGKGGGYILSPGAADVMPKVENLIAMVDAAKEYGTYT